MRKIVKKYFFSLYRLVSFGAFNIADIQIEADKDFIDKLVKKYALALSKDSFDSYLLRSYLQFLCQKRRLSFGRILVLNLTAGVLALPLCLMSIVLLFKRKDKASCQKQGAILLPGIAGNLLPLSLKREFFIEKNQDAVGSSLRTVFVFFQIVYRFPFEPYFLIKVYWKVLKYEGMLKISPEAQAIICTSEYSFTSSFLTGYLKEKKVEHINIMHGEKLFFIRDAFVSFSRFYVWDRHYEQLFLRMKAKPGQFIVELPQKLSGLIKPRDRGLSNSRRLTYFFAGEKDNDLLHIFDNLLKLKKQGYEITVRPHPRYTNMDFFSKLFRPFVIQKSDVSIDQAVVQTDYVISLYSTVLYEAYLMGAKIVIDDLSLKNQYNALLSLDYIILQKKHQLLSELLDG